MQIPARFVQPDRLTMALLSAILLYKSIELNFPRPELKSSEAFTASTMVNNANWSELARVRSIFVTSIFKFYILLGNKQEMDR